jgi:ribosomal protein L21
MAAWRLFQAGPASRVLDSSGIAVERFATFVNRERQRIVRVCECREQAHSRREQGCRRAAGVLVLRQVAGG